MFSVLDQYTVYRDLENNKCDVSSRPLRAIYHET